MLEKISSSDRQLARLMLSNLGLSPKIAELDLFIIRTKINMWPIVVKRSMLALLIGTFFAKEEIDE